MTSPQKNKKRVFILGAGSSIGHSNGVFPSINQFFGFAKNLNLDLSGEYKLVTEYAKKTKGIDISQNTDLNIENLFTHLEIDIEKNSSPELLNTRQLLLRLIRQILLGLKDDAADSDYHKFKNKLEDGDSIITFNWDILLDDILNRSAIITHPEHGIGSPKHYHKSYCTLSAFAERTKRHVAISHPYQKWKGGWLLFENARFNRLVLLFK